MPWLIDQPALVGLRYRRGTALLALSAGLAASAAPALAQDTAAAPKAQQASAERASAPAQDVAGEGALEAGQVAVPAPPADVALPKVEPVISDKEFNSSVPSLDAADDPELDKPLESIEAFERRLAAQQTEAKPETEQAAPSGDTALSGGDTAGEIGDAPVNDTELAAPLPSLDTFEVAPVQFAKDESADEKEAEAAYSIDLQGLDEADKQTDVSLKGEFNSFSALKKGGGKAANTAMVRARLNEDSQLLQTILASEGWYSPVVRTRLTPSRDKTRKGLVALLSVNPGKRYVFSDIVIKADPTEPPGLIADNLPLKTGAPIIADRVQGAEARVAVALPENGYPFAEVGDRDILLDRDTGEGVYTLPVTVGPRGRFDSFKTDGDLAFNADHIRVLSRFKHGEIYDSRKVDDLRKALVATNLFRAVSVEPERSGETQSDGTEYVTLHVHQEAGPPRTIAGSLGYAAGEGLTTQGTWTHRNLFPPEGALIASATAGTQKQGAGVTFRRSNAGKRDRTFELTAEAFHNSYDAYSAYTGRLAAHISRDSTPLWQKRHTYAYGVELLATAETDYDAESGDRKRHTYYVAGLNGQLGFDTTDNLLNPAKGFRLTALVQPETTIDGGFNPYVRARLDASTYYSVSDNLILAGRIRLGTIQGTGLFDIAPSRRLYAGGGGSVRGYAYQALGEQAPDGKPVGGRSLNEGSIEARYRFGNYGVVAFVDAGQAYRETMPQLSDLRYGVGLGGRFYTNFGPIRLDVATPVNRRSGESLINVYVSIGQAF